MINRILFKLCYLWAKLIIWKVKYKYPNSSNIFATDPDAQKGTQLSTDVIRNIMANLPEYMKVLNSQMLPEAQAKLATEQATSPQYQELLTSLYEKFAPRLAKTGADVDTISRTGSAEGDVSLLKGAGGEAARGVSALDKQLNPEYYATRSAAGGKLGELLGSINLNNANPEAERLINQENQRSGNSGAPSATNTVSNALSFGNELQKRRDSLGSAINTASGFLAPASGTFNTANIALGKGPTNTGLTNFAGVQTPSNTATGVGSNLLGINAGLTGQERQIQSEVRDPIDRLNEAVSAY